MIVSDSSEGVNSESTQGTTKKNPFMLLFAMAKMFLSYLIPILSGSNSNFFTENQHCESPANHPAINTEGDNYNSYLWLGISVHMLLN